MINNAENGQIKIQCISRGCFKIPTTVSEKKRSIMVTKSDVKREIVKARTARLAASFLLSATTITVSNLPVATTLIIADTEEIIARSPNSSGVNILVSMGEKRTGML